eukprot:12328404-Alexandrium_andersonii.AAC.1
MPPRNAFGTFVAVHEAPPELSQLQSPPAVSKAHSALNALSSAVSKGHEQGAKSAASAQCGSKQLQAASS